MCAVIVNDRPTINYRHWKTRVSASRSCLFHLQDILATFIQPSNEGGRGITFFFFKVNYFFTSSLPPPPPLYSSFICVQRAWRSFPQTLKRRPFYVYSCDRSSSSSASQMLSALQRREAEARPVHNKQLYIYGRHLPRRSSVAPAVVVSSSGRRASASKREQIIL